MGKWALIAIALLAFGKGAVPPPPAMSLTSTAFHNHERIPLEHASNESGCSGKDISPPLQWRNPPPGTKSFVLTVFDMDEHRTPSGWWQWVVYDLPGNSTSLPAGAGAARSQALPPGSVQGRVDSGHLAYDGPCPDAGEPPHRYVFTLYALKVAKLPVPPESSGALVTHSLHDFTLAKATLIGLYARP